MNAEELIKKVIASGADEDGIRDRFGSNYQLYELCFREFLEEPNFAALEKAMASRDYKTAFASAHSLKGVSGNLGLTTIYDAVSILTQSLRTNNCDNADAECGEVLVQLKKLIDKFTENEPTAPSLPH